MSTGGKPSTSDQTVTSRMVDLAWLSADVATSETTTSTSYTNLATTGPAVTPIPGVTQDQLISVGATAQFSVNVGANVAYMAPSISAATALDKDGAAAVANASISSGAKANFETLAASVPSGSVHTSKYRVTGGTGGFDNRRAWAVPL